MAEYIRNTILWQLILHSIYKYLPYSTNKLYVTLNSHIWYRILIFSFIVLHNILVDMICYVFCLYNSYIICPMKYTCDICLKLYCLYIPFEMLTKL